MWVSLQTEREFFGIPGVPSRQEIRMLVFDRSSLM